MKRLTITIALLLITAGFAHFAYAETVSDWEVDTTDPTVMFAATANDNEHVFGEFCFPEDGSCYWVVSMSVPCKEGDRYPILANSDAAAISVELLCIDANADQHQYRYAFTNFDQIDKVIRSSSKIGFAMPMQEDTFRVIRFNLKGVEKALSIMHNAVASKSKPAAPAPKGFRVSNRVLIAYRGEFRN